MSELALNSNESGGPALLIPNCRDHIESEKMAWLGPMSCVAKSSLFYLLYRCYALTASNHKGRERKDK
jgi:hypothetical protein